MKTDACSQRGLSGGLLYSPEMVGTPTLLGFEGFGAPPPCFFL